MAVKEPVLLIIFNRPDKVRAVMQAISIYAPEKLYITADGPRINHSGDIEKCEAARKAALESITWPCEVKTRFLDENMGCGPAPSSGTTWFFEHEERGIILEDDCLPHPDFFNYCSELLEKYKDHTNVMKINGNLLTELPSKISHSYFFSKFSQGPGYATWRRAWKHFSFQLQEYDAFKNSDILEKINPNRSFKKYWIEKFNIVEFGQRDIWDYQWAYAIWKNNGICITPAVNLVSNIGFDEEGTHTKGDSVLGNRKTFPILPLKHPAKEEMDKKRDQHLFENIFFVKEEKTPLVQKLKNKLSAASAQYFQNEENLKFHPEKTIGSYAFNQKIWKFYSGDILKIEKEVVLKKWHLSVKHSFNKLLLFHEQSGLLASEIFRYHAIEKAVIFRDSLSHIPYELLATNLNENNIPYSEMESTSFNEQGAHFLVGIAEDNYEELFQNLHQWHVKEAVLILRIKKSSALNINTEGFTINFRGVYYSKRPLMYPFLGDSDTVNIVCLHLSKNSN
ncbi:MAG: hypothetical protein MH137_01750 [Flavobacteriales bacterium]|nr:hypothetical protein [Flavobacteriales bacterium]